MPSDQPCTEKSTKGIMLHPDGRPILKGDGTFLTMEEWEYMLGNIVKMGSASAEFRYKLVQNIFVPQK